MSINLDFKFVSLLPKEMQHNIVSYVKPQQNPILCKDIRNYLLCYKQIYSYAPHYKIQFQEFIQDVWWEGYEENDPTVEEDYIDSDILCCILDYINSLCKEDLENDYKTIHDGNSMLTGGVYTPYLINLLNRGFRKNKTEENLETLLDVSDIDNKTYYVRYLLGLMTIEERNEFCTYFKKEIQRKIAYYGL